jgi:hypothetical protein
MHRDITCQYCDEVMTVAELDAHYDHGCNGATAICSECEATMVRHRLEKHKSQDCPEGEERCRWHTAGCRVSEKRRIVQEHEQNGCLFEAVGRLLEERAEDRKIIDDLTGRLTALEMRNRRREQRRERRNEAAPQPTNGAISIDISDLGLSEDGTLFIASTPENGAWGSPEDYMLAQFERMETQMDDLRKKMMEMDAHQSLNLLQHTARANEQLAELASKVGVLNMHTNWLMNMQRQNYAQQRAGSTAGPPNPGMSAANDSGATRSSSENGLRRQGGSRRNSDGRGENPPRL